MTYIIFTLLHNLLDFLQVNRFKTAKHWDSFFTHCSTGLYSIMGDEMKENREPYYYYMGSSYYPLLIVDVCGGVKAYLGRRGVSVIEVGLPGEVGKCSGRDAAWGRGVCSVKSVYKLLGVSEVSGWFPTVMPSVVAFPFDEVLMLVTILTTVEDPLHLVFKFVVHLYGVWRGWYVSVDFVTLPRGKTVNVEDRVLVHKWWEE